MLNRWLLFVLNYLYSYFRLLDNVWYKIILAKIIKVKYIKKCLYYFLNHIKIHYRYGDITDNMYQNARNFKFEYKKSIRKNRPKLIPIIMW